MSRVADTALNPADTVLFEGTRGGPTGVLGETRSSKLHGVRDIVDLRAFLISLITA